MLYRYSYTQHNTSDRDFPVRARVLTENHKCYFNIHHPPPKKKKTFESTPIHRPYIRMALAALSADTSGALFTSPSAVPDTTVSYHLSTLPLPSPSPSLLPPPSSCQAPSLRRSMSQWRQDTAVQFVRYVEGVESFPGPGSTVTGSPMRANSSLGVTVRVAGGQGFRKVMVCWSPEECGMDGWVHRDAFLGRREHC